MKITDVIVDSNDDIYAVGAFYNNVTIGSSNWHEERSTGFIAKFDDQSGTIGYDSVNDKIHLDQGHVGDSPKIITLNMDGSVDQIRVATQLSAGNYVSDSYNNPSVIYEDHWYPAYADTGGGATGKLQ